MLNLELGRSVKSVKFSVHVVPLIKLQQVNIGQVNIIVYIIANTYYAKTIISLNLPLVNLCTCVVLYAVAFVCVCLLSLYVTSRRILYILDLTVYSHRYYRLCKRDWKQLT